MSAALPHERKVEFPSGANTVSGVDPSSVHDIFLSSRLHSIHVADIVGSRKRTTAGKCRVLVRPSTMQELPAIFDGELRRGKQYLVGCTESGCVNTRFIPGFSTAEQKVDRGNAARVEAEVIAS